MASPNPPARAMNETRPASVAVRPTRPAQRQPRCGRTIGSRGFVVAILLLGTWAIRAAVRAIRSLVGGAANAAAGGGARRFTGTRRGVARLGHADRRERIARAGADELACRQRRRRQCDRFVSRRFSVARLRAQDGSRLGSGGRGDLAAACGAGADFDRSAAARRDTDDRRLRRGQLSRDQRSLHGVSFAGTKLALRNRRTACGGAARRFRRTDLQYARRVGGRFVRRRRRRHVGNLLRQSPHFFELDRPRHGAGGRIE